MLSSHRIQVLIVAGCVALGGLWLSNDYGISSRNPSSHPARHLFDDMGLLAADATAYPTNAALKAIDGSDKALSDFRGRVVLISFWTTWCQACITEMPSIERLNRRLSGRPFAVVAINLREPVSDVRRFMEKNQFSFPVFTDTDGRAAAEYRVRALPTNLIADANGRVVATALGSRKWDSRESLALFEGLIRGDNDRSEDSR
jgi:thiol-disulfide isomerase/thioredoxin